MSKLISPKQIEGYQKALNDIETLQGVEIAAVETKEVNNIFSKGV